MTRHRFRTMSTAGAVLFVATSLSSAEPLNTMDDVGAAIEACWTPPPNSDGSSVTLSFSFGRDGSLIGPPRPTAIDVDGDRQARQRFVDAAIEALSTCVPLDFAPVLAEGIGGEVFTMRFFGQPVSRAD